MRKILILLLIFSSLVVFGTMGICQENITVGTASIGGTFYVFGTGIAQIITKYAEGVGATAEVTDGSVNNAQLVGSDQTDMGLAMADVVYGAYNGTGKFDRKFEELRGLFMAYGQMMHILVREDSDIYSVADLKGKKVSPGPAGSGTNSMTVKILESFGIDPEKDIKLEYLSHEEESMALGDGTIDAAFYLMGTPCAALQNIVLAIRQDLFQLRKKI